MFTVFKPMAHQHTSDSALNLWITNTPGKGLLLLIEDATASGTLEQSLTQERNELWLLQHQLSHANTQLEDLSQFKSFVLAMAAHEIANPLNVICVYADHLLVDLPEDTVAGSTKGMLTVIQRQSKYLRMLLKTLLNFDQLEQGRLAVQIKPCKPQCIGCRNCGYVAVFGYIR